MNRANGGWHSRQQSARLVTRHHVVEWPRRPLITGIVNINDDSFSGDGTLDVDAALAIARSMIAAGADVIDVGGESARPNRAPISIEEEITRVRPFLERFRTAIDGIKPRDAQQHFPPLLSLNTWRPEVASVLLPIDADLLNDMGALPDSRNARVCAQTGAALLIMHSVGEPKSDQRHVRYDDIVADVLAFFNDKIAIAIGAGVPESSIVLDPGLDFAKPFEDNLRLIRALPTLAGLGAPLLLPISRKRIISEALGGRPATERDAGTVGLAISCALRGAHILRVHDVGMTWCALKMLDATP
jgi:dihydropteroate synthase